MGDLKLQSDEEYLSGAAMLLALLQALLTGVAAALASRHSLLRAVHEQLQLLPAVP